MSSRQRPLRDVADVVDPNPSHRNPEYFAEGFPFISTAEFLEPEGIELATRRRVALATVEEQEARCAFSDRSVLFSRKGTIGKTRLLPSVRPRFALLDSLCVINAGPELDPRYLCMALRSPAVAAQIDAATRGVALKQVSVGRVRDLAVPVPALDEQRRIVAKLDALRARSRRAKDALDAVPALLDRLRQSILAAAFRGDLTADWREQNPNVEPASELLKRIRIERRKRWEEAELAKLTAKGKAPKDDRWKSKYVEPEPVDETDLPELPDGWCWASVDDLVFAIEAGASFKCEERPPRAGETGVAKVSAVTWGEYNEQESKTCVDAGRVDDALLVRTGDFLLSRANTIELVGAPVIVGATSLRVMLSDKILRLRFAADEGLQRWTLCVLRSPWGRRSIEDASTGNQLSMRNIAQSALRGIALPLPSAVEMHELASRTQAALAGVGRLGDCAAGAGRAVRSLDAATLAAAFRGELAPPSGAAGA